MQYVIVGKVDGQPDLYYNVRKLPGQETWQKELLDAEIYHDEKDALGALDRIRRAMEIHLGRDLKTGKPILDPMTKQPIKRIDLPFHIFHLLRLSRFEGTIYKVYGKATIFVCTLERMVIEPTEHFIEVEGTHPGFQEQEKKEN
jgi:hypothetical protein